MRDKKNLYSDDKVKLRSSKVGLSLTGFTDFERQVYRAILNIPFGQTRSYQWVAEKIGKPKAVRAVGTALKKNPFAPIIPCHRVVKNDGGLGGYSGGIRKKIKLLRLEKEIKGIILS